MKKIVIVLLLLPLPVFAADARKPNVLFIAVDDLNHWVGHLGRNPQTKTPNMDRLAKMGVTFTRAYCAAPVCNPSRAALMSGMRPGETGVYDNGEDWRPAIARDKTLTTQFVKAGYHAVGCGKIYHGAYDRRDEWAEYQSNPAKGKGKGKVKLDPSAKGEGVGGIRFAPLQGNDNVVPDTHFVTFAIEQMQKKHDRPLFLCVGLQKPHMPWNVPKKYYDLFPLDSIQLPPHKEDDLKDVPAGGLAMAKASGDHATMLKSGRWKEAVQGYLAAIAYCDGQVGRLLDALEKSPIKDDTIICFWGDHGWHLGEKQHWRKFALWEEATRAPLIWVAPGVTKAGGVCERTVDFMSIYPTLCELTGMTVPSHAKAPSLKPLLMDPKAKWEHPGITTFRRNNHAVRTEKWRYIRYADGGEELYDHDSDPYEWTNLAKEAKHAGVKKELAKLLPKVNAPTLPKAR